MTNIDERIETALAAEEEELLARNAAEPGYFRQAFDLFRGRLGWVMWFVYIVQLLMFLAAAYALYRLFTAAEILRALQWGIGAVLLVQLTTFLRSFMGAHFEANRVLRAVARLELRLLRIESAGSPDRIAANGDTPAS